MNLPGGGDVGGSVCGVIADEAGESRQRKRYDKGAEQPPQNFVQKAFFLFAI